MPAKPDLEISPECECSRERAGRHQMAMLGVRADGRKELVAITDGYRESTESWADLLRDCKRRGMTAPVLAVGEGALGFWKAMREVFPATKQQRCWFHKQANVLAALPKSAHPAALAAIKDIYNAEDIDRALVASKPSRSTFATVRLRTKVTKGPGSRAVWIAMAYTLIDAAQAHWRAVNAQHLVALVRAGAVFHKGKLLERPTDITPPQPPSDGDQHPATEVA